MYTTSSIRLQDLIAATQPIVHMRKVIWHSFCTSDLYAALKVAGGGASVCCAVGPRFCVELF